MADWAFTYSYRFSLSLISQFLLLVVEITHACECIDTSADGVYVYIKSRIRDQIIVEYGSHGPLGIFMSFRLRTLKIPGA